MGLKRKLRLISAAVLIFGLVTSTHAEVIFSESFDDQPDWNSGLPNQSISTNNTGGSNSGGWDVDIAQFADTHTIPVNWSFVRQTPKYAPSRGDADRQEVIEINAASTAENSNRTRSGTGKSFVTWRSSSSSQFSSDGLLMKHYPEGFDQLYVEFWINYSNETVATYYNPDYSNQTTGLSKLFRIYHWDGTGDAFDYYTNNINPNMIWGFEGRPSVLGGYGFRNTLSFLTRRDRSLPEDDQRYINHYGNFATKPDTSYNPGSRAPYGGVAFEDKKNGGLIDQGDAVNIDQVFGDETVWTKVAFFVKMNSAPGVHDGAFIQWIDGRKSIEINTMAWIAASKDMVKWTTFGLGGNDNFIKYPNELLHTEWYAIDDIKVSTNIPNALLSDSNKTTPPNPPLNFSVE